MCTTEFKNNPNIMRYPLEKIIERFKTDYFGAGPDYALAYALYKGYTDIHIYGVLMAVGDEYTWQKPTFEHWVGIALGMPGVNIKVHDNTKDKFCTICKLPPGVLYGFRTVQKNPVQVVEE
jgi:hypothetical protein